MWSASRALLVDEEMTALFEGSTAFTRVIVPVIVTGARLWECRLVDGLPIATEVDYMRVRTPTTGNAVLIHVMSLDRFGCFAKQISELQNRADPAWVPSRMMSDRFSVNPGCAAKCGGR